jgi:signal transduction histidine kinase/DNA-binding NarL/FixJ family response regulator
MDSTLIKNRFVSRLTALFQPAWPQGLKEFGHRSGLLWLLAFLLLLGGVAVTYQSHTEFVRTLQRVQLFQEALKENATLLQFAVDLETGHRGFLLTGDEKYLEPYQIASMQVPAQFARLNALLSEFTDFRRVLRQLERNLAAKQKELAVNLSLYKDHGREAALGMIKSDLGKQTMDKIRGNVTNIQHRLRGSVAAHQSFLQRLIVERNIVIYFTTALAVFASVAALVLLRRHLTDLRKEEALRARVMEFQRESREKSTFLANMSHEIRTPLNAIFGFGELLARRTTDSVSRRYVEAMLTSGRSLLALINDILDLAKIEAGKLEVRPAPMSLREAANEVITMFQQTAAKKNVHLRAVLDTQHADGVSMDAVRVRQMLCNLVGNAIKYTDQGQVILRITTGAGEPEAGAVRCVLQVEDTGVGVASEELDEIFDPFIQAKRAANEARGGAGLGLSITRQLARMMGGDISVESTPGKGSVFRITMPHVARAFAVGSKDEDSRSLDDMAPLKVLVVDDVELNRQMLQEMFNGTAHEVFTASSGESAIAVAKAQHPDLILMDIRMPLMSGEETLNHFRGDPGLKAARVIAVTAATMRGEESRLRRLFDGYLAKPLSQDALIREIARVVGTKTRAAQQLGDVAGLDPSADGGPAADADAVDMAAEDVAELRRLLSESWPELRRTLQIRAVRQFAGALQSVAERAGAHELKAYAERLAASASVFDVAQVEALLEELPQHVREFA